MKKKLLLLALPALMALSSCTYLSSGVAQPKGNFFREEATACEEVFGEVKKANLLNPVPFKSSAEDLATPIIGVQYRAQYNIGTELEPDYRVAVRFIAAVKSLDVDATWTRSVYKPDGTRYGDQKSYPTTQAYRELNANGDPITPEAWTEDDSYHFFVAYTLYDIPAGTKDEYYITAYVTLSDQSKVLPSVDSKVKAAQIGKDNIFEFATNEKGYYLWFNDEKKIKEDSPTRNDSGNLASFTINNIDEDESFLIVRNDPDNGVFKVIDSSCLEYGDQPEIKNSFIDNEGFIMAIESGKFALYLNNDGELYRFKYGPSGYYVRGDAAGDADWGLHDGYQFTACPTEDGNVGVLLNVHLGTAAKGFKIGDSSWNNEWGYWGYKRDGGGYNWRGTGNSNITGGAAGNFSAHASEGGDVKNIVCNTAGYYNIYLTNSGYVSFELVSAD